VSLGKIAARTDCAILLKGHLTKSQTKAQYRGLGSQDIFNAIPSVLNLGKVDEDVRVLVHIKRLPAKAGRFDRRLKAALRLKSPKRTVAKAT